MQTNDGSWTLFSETYGEHFKSRHAAAYECEEVFLRPGVWENPHFGQATPFRILELGFGLGTNFSALVKAGFQGEFISIDHDLTPARLFQQRFAQAHLEKILAEPVWESAGLRAQILNKHFNDALATLPLEKKFHTVFFDPFSPQSNPEAWSPAIFQAVYNLLVPEGRLVTYSVARIAKDGATQAGFRLQKRKNSPQLRKRSSLLAIK